MATPHLIATRAHLRVREGRRMVIDVFRRDGVIDPDEQRAIDALDNAERTTKASAAERSLGICLAKGVVTRAHLVRLVDAYTATVDELPDPKEAA